MFKKLLLTIFTATLSICSAAPSRATPKEMLFEHILIFTKKATAQSGIHVSPWAICYDLDKSEDALFLSRPVFSEDQQDLTRPSALLSWLTDLINEADKNNVRRMICAYEIDHFSKCRQQTVFELQLNYSHQVTFFEHIYEQEACLD